MLTGVVSYEDQSAPSINIRLDSDTTPASQTGL